MRIISTRIHGVLDYPLGLIIATSPWLFNFAQGGLETWLPLFIGLTVIIYSSFTKHECALVKIIPMHVHLIIDGVCGGILALSPWLFHLDTRSQLPLLALGMTEVVAAVLTQRISRAELDNMAAAGN